MAPLPKSNRPRDNWLPCDDWSEYSFVPDLVVADIAYCYTGLRDPQGNKILRRVTRKIGFLADNSKPEYVLDHDERYEPDNVDPERDDDDLDESEALEGE